MTTSLIIDCKSNSARTSWFLKIEHRPQFQQSGQGDVASSWVGKGPNKTIAANDLAKALGTDQINTLMAHTGMSRDELIAGLSQALPEAVNHLTPEGRVPTEQELSRSL